MYSVQEERNILVCTTVPEELGPCPRFRGLARLASHPSFISHHLETAHCGHPFWVVLRQRAQLGRYCRSIDGKSSIRKDRMFLRSLYKTRSMILDTVSELHRNLSAAPFSYKAEEGSPIVE
jgi:hypothetical protein